MKKLFITLLCAVFVVAASAQTRYLRINQLDGTVTKIAISTIDSIDFVIDNSRLENGYQAIDLGLPSGTLWATCNVGAENPEDYGNYYAWGETETKEIYSWSTYAYGSYDSSDTQNYGMTKYNKADGKTVLDPEDDAATQNWGGDWRMPTNAEQNELLNTDNCTWTWTTDYNGTGIKGYIVSSNAEDNTNSIFLPAAGCRGSSLFYDDGSHGYYWSSSLGTSYPNRACYLYFDPDYYVWNDIFRSDGQSVRPVCSSK